MSLTPASGLLQSYVEKTGDPGKQHDRTQAHAGIRPKCGGKKVPNCDKVGQKCVLQTTDYLPVEMKNS